MPRFSLRDLFWLTLVVGLGLGWWNHHRWTQKLEIEYRRMLLELGHDMAIKEMELVKLRGVAPLQD